MTVVAHWTLTVGVMWCNSDRVKTCFHAAAMLVFSVTQRSTIPKFCIFRKSITVRHCNALLQVTLVSIPPHKFVRPPCWYYGLYEIAKNGFRTVSIGITSVPNFIQIRLAVLELNRAERRADMTSPMCVHFVQNVRKTQNKYGYKQTNRHNTANARLRHTKHFKSTMFLSNWTAFCECVFYA
jgi:hypothetical protein